MRALLVEDSRTCAEVAIGLLRAANYRVVRLTSAVGALGALRGGAFELAVIDVQIPAAEGGAADLPRGLDVARAVREALPGVQLVLWPAAASAELRAQAAELGAVVVVKGDRGALERAIAARAAAAAPAAAAARAGAALGPPGGFAP